MSSEENEDSLKISSQNNASKNLSFKDDVIRNVSIKQNVRESLSIKDNLSGNISIEGKVSGNLSINDNVCGNISIKDNISGNISISDSVNGNFSIKDNASANLSSVDKQEVITKCLIIEPQENRNVIPSCSNDANSLDAYRDRTPGITEVVSNKTVSEFIVIDLTCDVDDESDLCRSENAIKDCRIDCDSSEASVETRLVPVGHNEIARRENEKTVKTIRL
ncbi:Uncharacterized protein OBRU01_01224 [Operophtera brumata]|uniref:Uncharacterized protein n=1 Tax=Operophtera brumata TaxID=104452 RepID=A0A0L7LUC2_OPEBR|nr:Uncharacterized protein OBRU01_01224 [Operophtera brumata]